MKIPSQQIQWSTLDSNLCLDFELGMSIQARKLINLTVNGESLPLATEIGRLVGGSSHKNLILIDPTNLYTKISLFFANTSGSLVIFCQIYQDPMRSRQIRGILVSSALIEDRPLLEEAQPTRNNSSYRSVVSLDLVARNDQVGFELDTNPTIFFLAS